MRRALLLLIAVVAGTAHAQVTFSGGVKLSGGVSVVAGASCTITTQTLPSATVGVFYNTTLQTANCIAPLSFSVVSGSFPGWATLNPSTGQIFGNPSNSGTSTFKIQLLDSSGKPAFVSPDLGIIAVSNGGLPNPIDPLLANWNTSRANTPASGPYICIGTLANAGALSGGCSASFTTAQLQTAINTAACGDIFVLQNTTYTQQAITIPRVVCTQGNWIWVTRDITDTTFPAEGTRVDPCYTGLPQSQIPYYPYPTADTTPNTCSRHMPQIMVKAQNNIAPISLQVGNAPAASYWRFIGLELTRDQTTDILTVGGIDLNYQPNGTGQDCSIASNGIPNNATACMNDQPTNLIFDQMVIHGDAQRQTTRAFSLGGARWVALLDSFGYDMQLSAAGGGGDAQFFAGGFGKGYTNVGWWKFDNNFTVASTMASLFCGAYTEPVSPATGFDGVPHDVEWIQSFMTKNPLWDTQIGTTIGQAVTIEGQSYGPRGDQELVQSPASVQVALGTTYQFNNTWLNDTYGGYNRVGNSTNGTMSVCDSNGNNCVVNGNSTVGIITTNGEHSVGTVPWQSVNLVTRTYTACSGNGTPIAACTGATTIATHVIKLTTTDFDIRQATLGNNRTLTATSLLNVVASNPTKQIDISPNAPDLQIQPSYSPGNGVIRQFCMTMYATTNYSNGALTWSVNGIAGGNSSVGTITTPSGVAANEAIYCSPSTSPVTADISASDGVGIVNPSNITVTTSAPIVGYDLKPFVSKNGWETKCVLRGLFQFNLVELAWGGQGNGGGQPGTSALCQAINNASQVNNGNGVNVGYGPAYVTDMLVDHNEFLHFGQGATIAALNVALGVHRIAFTNNLFDDVNYIAWTNGFIKASDSLQYSGAGCQKPPCPILGWTSLATPLSDNITFSHNTVIGTTTSILSLSNWKGQFQLGPFTMQNNILTGGGNGGNLPFFSNSGDPQDCNVVSGPNNSNELNTFLGGNVVTPCTSTYSISPNVFYDLANGTITSIGPTWPSFASLYTPTHSDPTLFTSYNGGNGGNYTVPAGSPYAAGGTKAANDGLAQGADISGITTAISAVRVGTRTP